MKGTSDNLLTGDMASVPDNDTHTDDLLLTTDEDEGDDHDLLTSKTESIPPPSVLLATAGYDHTIRFWDVVSGVCTNTLQYNLSQVNHLDITTDKRILGAAGHSQIHIFDTTSAAGPIRVLEGQSGGSTGGNVTSIGFHQEDPWLFSVSDEGSLKIWDLRAARCQRDIDNKVAINGAVLHPNQTEILTADQNGSVRIWDLRSSSCTTEMIPEEHQPLRSVTVSSAGDRIAVANNLGRVYVWGLAPDSLDFNYVPISKVQAHRTYITKVKFSPNGEYIATASADHTVGLWQTASCPIPTRQSSDQSGSSSGGSRWAKMDDDEEDEEKEVWTHDEMSDVDEERLLLRHSFEGHLKWVWDCAFSADSAYLVSASSDNTARLWSVSSGDCICIYTGHTKALTSVALNDLAL